MIIPAGEIIVDAIAVCFPEIARPAFRRAYSLPFGNGPPALV
ncbi:MAG: hypothetical protein ABI442_03895 [Gemmatimonadaceae bacterium]